TDNNQAQKPEGINRRRLVLDLLAVAPFFALFLFLPAGTWLWAKGGLFLLVFVASGALAWVYLWRVNPELLTTDNNQAQKPEGINRRRLVFDLLAVAPSFALFLSLPAGTWLWAKGG